ncbi:MAG: helix-turn-helix domain-containing protein [Candidatus Lokiarchaeota archaeon]|nr:helix-turn-helix domain-containing protein [Candidatus Lokiarchaeota archaeon]
MELSQNQEVPVLEPKEMRVLKVSGSEVSKITKALKSPTRQKILQIIKHTPMDVSRLAQELGQTEANISAQIKNLEKVGLVKSRYEPGGHGVRKICETVVDKVIITLE